jgi:16S rRNA processing protein RimM
LTYSKKTKTGPLANSAAAATGWALLAHLVRPQGRHGEILADVLTDFPERFAERKRLFLIPPDTLPSDTRPASAGQKPAPATLPAPPREIALEHHWLHKGRIVFKFAGIDSISDAEKLRGLDVAIPASERAELTDGAMYISDLLGCEVFDLAGGAEMPIGRVMDVDRVAALLVVGGADGEVLVPFVQAYLEKIDLAARRIEMRLPAGLLEINAPLSEEERAVLKAHPLDSSGDGE